MKPRILSATFLLLLLIALAAGAGCGHEVVTQPPPQEGHGIEQGPVPPPWPGGPDTARAGGTATLTWKVWNESQAPFTMEWTLQSETAWPGLPQNGHLNLGSLENVLLATTVSVPDTATPGYHRLTLTITRPSGSPTWTDGTILVQP